MKKTVTKKTAKKAAKKVTKKIPSKGTSKKKKPTDDEVRDLVINAFCDSMIKIEKALSVGNLHYAEYVIFTLLGYKIQKQLGPDALNDYVDEIKYGME